MKVAIGAPTYNDSERIQDLFATVNTFTDFEDEYSLVMLDDGTQNQDKVEQLEMLSKEYAIPLIKNEHNMGIPYSWNRLSEYYEDAEYVVLFNDDIQICASSWLNNIIYFLENNHMVGAVGLPLIHIDPATGKRKEDLSSPDESVQPGKVGSPVGCAFAFRKSLWDSIKHNDGSIGFWSSLVSFYEELDFGFELAKRGYACFMLPTPAVEHWGSQTFANNAELSIRSIIDYLPKDEYINILREGQDKLALPLEKHIEQAEKGMAYRMDYSRVMFAKKWECKDKWNVPQEEVHVKYVDPLPKTKICWLDKNNQEQEALL